MSRVGKQPIPIPSGVKIDRKDGIITVQGPKGKLTQKIHDEITMEIKDNEAIFTRPSDSKYHRALHGLYRALVANMVKGVTQGFSRELEIEGVGYKAEQTGKATTFALGYSHPISVLPPEGVEIKVLAPTKLVVSGIDKQIVGQVATKIRSLRPPEPYKGKGVRYAGEHIRRKAGKTAGA
jgi:large subunit ribosomal protein L6